QEFLRYFFKRLALTKDDVVILDRETGIGQLVFEEAQAAHLGVVVHAEHFSVNQTDGNYILWNNYYEYQFTNADKVDFFIVATDRQKEILKEQFRRYTNHDPKIYTIPVGSLPELVGQDKPRKPFSMITASRLAQEKHIDWLVRAVIEVHKTLPDITFDIYGSGSMDAKLREIIVEAQAGDYIRLMGHADLTDIYSQYEVYLTASTSEGFGLTLMEAVGSGLPMIGFDVPYGNQTFIEDGGNGYLLPVAENHVVDVITKSYKDAIVRLYEKGNIEAMRQKSYDLAKGFLTSQVKAAWNQLLEEGRS
ncbi:MAG: glycosyltransferase, partial [Streptococcus salivarius]|nr:glycosyltransferase [Streptococcus salivarius]